MTMLVATRAHVLVECYSPPTTHVVCCARSSCSNYDQRFVRARAPLMQGRTGVGRPVSIPENNPNLITSPRSKQRSRLCHVVTGKPSIHKAGRYERRAAKETRLSEKMSRINSKVSPRPILAHITGTRNSNAVAFCRSSDP